MAIKNRIKAGFKGYFRTYLRETPNSDIKYSKWRENAIIANAPIIITQLLGGVNLGLDQIMVKEQGALLFSAQIMGITYPSYREVMFTAEFKPNDFSGHFDEIQLINSTGGTFSRTIDLDFNKSDTQTLGIQWKIKVEFCYDLLIPEEDEALFPYRLTLLDNYPNDYYESDGKTYLKPAE